MANYKVPQDVEADDKLIGPFSFRQFVYLIIVALSLAAAWGLSQLFLPLAIIPLPVILLFGALALPLRKDQPMEIYLAAILSFYLKPRKRLWKADGIESLVEVVAPKTVEVQRAKDLSQDEAERRLSYLANIVDSQGWAVRGVSSPQPNSAMNSDVYFAAQQTEDILDDTTPLSQNFDHQLHQADTKRREDMINRIHQGVPTTPAPTAVATTPIPNNPYDQYASMPAPVAPEPSPDDSSVHFNPYPTIHQSVLQPLGDQIPAAPAPVPAVQTVPAQPTTSEKPVSPDIINLANQHDLSIETIQREANRIKQKEATLDDEVVISLR